jgi:hypothetical protein
MSMIRIGNRDYPRFTSPTCRTCQSPHRLYIENQLLLNRTYASIEREVAKMPTGHLPRPGLKSIVAHAKSNHMAAPQAAHRRIMDDRAGELGAALDGVDYLVDIYVLNKMILAVGWEKFMDGKMTITTSDLMAAMQFQHKLDTASDQGLDAQVMQEALAIYMDVATEFIPRERLAEYGSRLRANLVLRALHKRTQGHQDDDEVVDGQVLDSGGDSE